jgi:hypothetical protein
VERWWWVTTDLVDGVGGGGSTGVMGMGGGVGGYSGGKKCVGVRGEGASRGEGVEGGRPKVNP